MYCLDYYHKNNEKIKECQKELYKIKKNSKKNNENNETNENNELEN